MIHSVHSSSIGLGAVGSPFLILGVFSFVVLLASLGALNGLLTRKAMTLVIGSFLVVGLVLFHRALPFPPGVHARLDAVLIQIGLK